MTTETVPAALLDDMRAFAATLRGSQAVGALRLIEHLDPASVRADAPAAEFCAHGIPFTAWCAPCEAQESAPHTAELRTFINPDTMRRTVRCHRCRGYQSNYRHTGEQS